MDVVWIALALVTIAYLCGWVLFLRRFSADRREGRKIEPQLLFFAILGGVVLVFLIVSKILMG
jgi:uncharacterized membrane protein YsdA (DUF1294 family)